VCSEYLIAAVVVIVGLLGYSPRRCRNSFSQVLGFAP